MLDNSRWSRRNVRVFDEGRRQQIVTFEQGHSSTQGHDAVVQRVAAVGTARAWPPLLRAEAGAAA